MAGEAVAFFHRSGTDVAPKLKSLKLIRNGSIERECKASRGKRMRGRKRERERREINVSKKLIRPIGIDGELPA